MGFSLCVCVCVSAMDLGLQVWSLVFTSSKMPLLEPYSLFLEESGSRVFSRDLWTQSYEFLRDTMQDLSNFDRDGIYTHTHTHRISAIPIDMAFPIGAWPSVIDDFVESYEKKLKE